MPAYGLIRTHTHTEICLIPEERSPIKITFLKISSAVEQFHRGVTIAFVYYGMHVTSENEAKVG